MKKTIHLTAGLPRAGQTLVYNILAQNPRLHLTSPAGASGLLMQVRNRWNRMVAFKASPNESGKMRVLQGIFEGYYENVDKPVIIDRSLGWLGVLEMAEAVLDQKVKVLVCVRDVRDVIATFEINWRNHPRMKQILQKSMEKHPDRQKLATVPGRCEVFSSGEQPFGIAFNQIKDAITRGYRDRLHIIEFEKLTKNPKETMQGIYAFLDEKEFEHDFNNIKQVIWENYVLYGMPERHQIPSKVEPVPPIWPRVLGKAAERYANQQAW